jgi:hypothetical protein
MNYQNFTHPFQEGNLCSASQSTDEMLFGLEHKGIGKTK